MSITSLISTVATLALLLLVGFIGGKTKIVDEVSTERLSTLIVKIGQPFLIVNSLVSLEYSPEKLKSGLEITLLGLGMNILMGTVAYLCARPIKPFDEQKLSEYAMIFANCGFVGFPIISALYGSEGLFYGGFYLISFHLTVWTWGIMILARRRSDIKLTPKKIILNYGTLPCIIGFLIYIADFTLPDCVYTLCGYLAGITTPIALIISGANIARRSMKKMLSNPHIYYVNLVKLILCPVMVASVAWLIGLPAHMIVFGAVMAAMPCAAVVTMFGEMYHISPGYGAELVGSSTLFCTLTIFPVVYFAQWLSTTPRIF